MMKPVVLISVWNESCGMLKLRRGVADGKDKSKAPPGRRRKKEKDFDLGVDHLVIDEESGSEDEDVKVCFEKNSTSSF